jgi:hypothetical protein
MGAFEMSKEITAVYKLVINRKTDDLEAVQHEFPEDKFGKRMVAIMLLQIAENLDPTLFEQNKAGNA